MKHDYLFPSPKLAFYILYTNPRLDPHKSPQGQCTRDER
jgi:hypothetical protein